MRKFLIPMLAALPLLAGGCVAKTLVDVVTMPVKATGQVVDWSTTSQDEADRNYGRQKRKEEAREGRDMRQADEASLTEAELREKQRNDRKRKRRDD